MVGIISSGISHQLARPVPRDISATLDLEDLDAPLGELRRRERKTGRSGATTEGDYRLMLDQQQEILGQLASQPAVDQGPLQLEHVAIRPPHDVDHQQWLAHGLRAARRARHAKAIAPAASSAANASSPRCPSHW